MTPDSARIVEIFSSIQGEGPLVGVRQVFVRFFGCNLRCIYCDTPDSLVKPDSCLIETRPGSREFDTVSSLFSASELEAVVQRFLEVPHHSVSLTGGEPLMHASFLQAFLPALKSSGVTTFLETNGILSKQLESVLDLVDIISMDIKLPGTLTPRRDFFPEHEEFLKLAVRKQVFVKLVVTPDTPEYEVARAAQLVRSVSESVPLVLQPVTPDGQVCAAPTPDQMLRLHALASGIHSSVRVIPQVHKLAGLL